MFIDSRNDQRHDSQSLKFGNGAVFWLERMYIYVRIHAKSDLLLLRKCIQGFVYFKSTVSTSKKDKAGCKAPKADQFWLRSSRCPVPPVLTQPTFQQPPPQYRSDRSLTGLDRPLGPL